MSADEFEALPGRGFSLALFGESRQELRARLGRFREFERAPGRGLWDSFDEFGIMVLYDESGKAAFMEADDTCTISLRRVQLTNRPFGEVLNDLRRAGVEFNIDDAGIDMPKLRVGLYTSAPEELSEPIEGVSVYQ